MASEWVESVGKGGARVIEDSMSPWGNRLTTIEVTFHRFVLAEFNTHRVFSRNSASSRAIPFFKQVERVRDNPAIPVEWRAEQKGMQGGDLLTEAEAGEAERQWIVARNAAVQAAENLAYQTGVHKSIVNRLLEPFMWHTVIVTATEWQGFWDQRCSPLAQPEIRVAAEAMREAYESSEPRSLGLTDWHLPYLDDDEYQELGDVELAKKVSSARCARVSYLTHDGVRSFEKDLELYTKLTSADPMHASPLEHVATPSNPDISALGNFTGWRQLRHDVEFERASKNLAGVQ